MKTLYKPFICSLFFLLSPFSLAEVEANDAAKLQQVLQTLKPFESDYHQITFSPTQQVLEQANGRFFLGENGAFRSEVISPEKTAMISDGKTLWMIDYELEQVSINLLADYLSDSPLKLILGKSANALDGFSVEKVSSNSKHEIYRLEPNNSYDAIKESRLAFKNRQINFIEIDEQRGRRVRFEFSSLREPDLNKKYPPEFPEHFDVVDEVPQDSDSESAPMTND